MSKKSTIIKYQNCLNAIYERGTIGITTEELFQKFTCDKGIITEGIRFGYLTREHGMIRSLLEVSFTQHQAKRIAEKISDRKERSAKKIKNTSSDPKPIISTSNIEEILQYIDDGEYIVSDEKLRAELRRRGYVGKIKNINEFEL